MKNFEFEFKDGNGNVVDIVEYIDNHIVSGDFYFRALIIGGCVNIGIFTHESRGLIDYIYIEQCLEYKKMECLEKELSVLRDKRKRILIINKLTS